MTTFSTKEVSEMVGVHWVTLLNWTRSGKVRASERLRAKGDWRWSEFDVEKVRQFKASNYRKGRGRKVRKEKTRNPNVGDRQAPTVESLIANLDAYGRQVYLYYNGTEHREFKQLVRELGQSLGTKNQTDTVLKALRRLHELSVSGARITDLFLHWLSIFAPSVDKHDLLEWIHNAKERNISRTVPRS
jgi:hypothetical protein